MATETKNPKQNLSLTPDLKVSFVPIGSFGQVPTRLPELLNPLQMSINAISSRIRIKQLHESGSHSKNKKVSGYSSAGAGETHPSSSAVHPDRVRLLPFILQQQLEHTQQGRGGVASAAKSGSLTPSAPVRGQYTPS
ncbi:hypothetical protein UY3_17279 [Chelonia mydas]|uniref:Uncharacterized protein n=1 Tax=Chelonia mydas TaxID=8469 RepID=M7AS25_CHEMY|nr:hypothetical protein UY3_17279 [Chelonia mydas]